LGRYLPIAFKPRKIAENRKIVRSRMGIDFYRFLTEKIVRKRF